MSNRQTLRKLSKEMPASPELEALFRGLSHEADRSAAIVAASITESVLERAMIKHFPWKRNPELLASLFENRGPASDFHGKIVISEAFGVITPVMASELQRMKAIRNVFAHARVPISFETPAIKMEMLGFGMLNAADAASESRDSPRMPRDKHGFLLTAQILCIILEGLKRRPRPVPIRKWLDTALLDSSPEKSPQQRRTRSNKQDRAQIEE